jgi:hypothetical protein
MAEASEQTEKSGRVGDETIAVEPEPADVLAALRELSAQVGVLQGDVHSLRAERHALPAVDGERPGWGDDREAVRAAPAWIRSLDSPGVRRPAIPWLLLELAFLAAVATAAAFAELETAAIVGVMAGAWVLVAVVEWVNARAARRRAEAAYAPLALAGVVVSDPSWFAPPVERTVLDVESETTGARLPSPVDD